MKLTAKLAYSQIIINRKRTAWTLLGIVLSAAMINAVYGFLASGYDMFTKDIGEGTYTLTLVGVGAVISLIIVTVAVNVVSNAFRISAGERTAQFGILKSVGATKRQIAGTVMYEGLMLSVIGIPIGIALGLVVTFIGVNVANHFLSAWNSIDDIGSELIFEYVIAWQAIAASVIVAFATVMLSAWLPAYKAAKIPAIDAIRGMGEVKLKAKQIRTNRLVEKLFGFEGLLAAKSLKRSSRNFRATVVSLTVSVILFVTVGGISAQVNNMTNLLFPNIDVSVAAQAMSAYQISFGDKGAAEEFIYSPIKSDTANAVTARLREFPDANLIGVGGFYHVSSATLPESMITPEMFKVIENRLGDGNYDVSVWLLTVDWENYAKLCGQAGVPLGSNILVNFYRYTANDGKKSAFVPYVFGNQTVHIESISLPATDVTLHGELREVPEELLHGFTGARSELTVIVPKLDAMYYNWFANPKDTSGFMKHANAAVNELIPQSGEVEMYVEVYDVREATDAIRNIINLIKVFIYGFVGMLTLIGLTNVISTISTNVRSRSREFAVLLSVGMAHNGLNRMLNLESILCSAKSLIIGLPLGGVASFLIHRFMMLSMGFDYQFPWLALVYCILGVFLITWVTMRYSVTQIRSGSIVEKIRKEVV